MIEIETEFGLLSVETIDSKNFISISKKDRSDQRLIGWIDAGSITANSYAALLHCISKLSNIFLEIMRYEAKLHLFLSIPLTNPFRDALLRMQIENTGQTLAVRKYIEEYNQSYTWTTYPKHGEQFEIEDSRNSDPIALMTPYGEFYLNQIDDYSFEVIKVTDNTEKILGLIRVPYEELPSDIMIAAFVQMLDIIYADTMDIIWKKTHETSKRTAEAIKYMFNYDKLRRALRKKGIE